MPETRSPARASTMRALLEQRAASEPDQIVMSIDGESVTADDLHQRVTSTANQMIALGVKPGERVGLYGLNSIEWVATFLACAYAGLRAVPINVAFHGDFLVRQLAQSEVALIFVDHGLVGAISAVADAVPTLRTVVIRGMEEPGAFPDGVSVVGSSYLQEGPRDDVVGAPHLNGDEPFCTFYTSGTTGPSKGAVVTQQYLLAGATTIADNFEFSSRDCLYGAMPLFHFGGTVGMMLPGLVSGATVALDSVFSVSGFWTRVAQERATVFVGVGPMVNMVFGPRGAAPRPEEMPLRLVLGAPVAPEVQSMIEETYSCVVRGVYGMTEVFPLCLHPLDGPAPPGSAGRLNPNFELKIVGDDGREVAAGAAGEVMARPLLPHVMFEGYEPLPEGAADSRLDWFATGDLGRLDETGNLSFVDRKKDAIRRRGENISSFEVERAFLDHPAVAECAAHAVPSDVGEDDVKICVVSVAGVGVPTAQDLFSFGADKLPRHAIPRYLEFLDELPKTVTGRVRKAELRDRLGIGHVWDRESLRGDAT